MEGPGPPSKRPRRQSQPKRELAQDMAPKPKRSRKGANCDAEALLSVGCAITDDKVLQILRCWKFSENVSRVNVMPRDSAFVLSDTLGLVCTRDGKVTPSRLTKRYPAVFKVFSTWARQAFPLTPPFAFTSISVNYNYSARIHRDSGNVGPSLTKAFGSFRGGSLKYWGEDDGSLSLEELVQFPATVLDTGKALCLFDGRRAHSVEPFEGERYSLVFFCTSAFSRAREDVLAFVSSLGAHVPTSASLQRALQHLAPAKGYDLGKQQLGIREMCGKQMKPTCVVWPTPSFMNIGNDCLDNCLSFVITPALTSSFCCVSKAISAAVHRPSSWSGTIIDASGRRPQGRLALTHFKSWSQARAVLGDSFFKQNNTTRCKYNTQHNTVARGRGGV